MSYIVLHMDKFKKEAVRGIQSHNNRERESRSNPDIDYQRSAGNYDLHGQAADYAQAIQNRIDDLLLVKAGCPAFQGYLFSKPIPVGTLERLLRLPVKS